MISNNHELTIGELDAVNGGSAFFPGTGPGLLEIISQIRQAIEGTQNPVSPPTQDGPTQQFQQLLNGLGASSQA